MQLRLRRGRLQGSAPPKAGSERQESARWIPAREQGGAPPGNRTLLVGFTARGLATSLATQSRREESNPRASTVGAWRSPLSYGEMTLSTGIEPASPGRQPGRIARRVRELGAGKPLVPPPAPPREIARLTCGPPGLEGMRQPKASTPSGIRTRVAGLRGRHPRSARRPGREPRHGDTFDARALAAGFCRPGGQLRWIPCGQHEEGRCENRGFPHPTATAGLEPASSG